MGSLEQTAPLWEDPKRMSAATLAFLGDAVYELLVRRRLAVTTIPANTLHQMAIRMVRAEAQSRAYALLEGVLTEEELAVMKRGRNSHPAHTAKNASVADYRRATVSRRCLAICISPGGPSAWRSSLR